MNTTKTIKTLMGSPTVSTFGGQLLFMFTNYFTHLAFATPGPHALWPTVKPVVHVMPRFRKNIEVGRSSKFDLSQFIALRFLKYLLYNAYVTRRVFGASRITAKYSQRTEEDTANLLRIHREWKALLIRNLVPEIHRSVREERSQLLVSDMLDFVEIPLMTAMGRQAQELLCYLPTVSQDLRDTEFVMLTVSNADHKRCRKNGQKCKVSRSSVALCHVYGVRDFKIANELEYKDRLRAYCM